MEIMTLEEVTTMLRETAVMHALVYDAVHGTVADEISEHEARKMYGKQWITDRTDRGLIHFNRVGSGAKSKKCYSKFEIESLKQSEKFMMGIVKKQSAKLMGLLPCKPSDYFK